MMETTVYIYMQTYELGIDYTERMINCVKAQTYPRFRCMIYDNGSSASTRNRIKQWICDDPRFTLNYVDEAADMGLLFTHAWNNIANSIDEEDYLTSIDADDEIAPTYIADMLEIAQREQVDVVAASSSFVTDADGILVGQRCVPKDILVRGAEICEVFPSCYQILRTHWGKLISGKVIKRADVRNLRAQTFGFDTLYVREILARSASLYITSKPLYIYHVYAAPRAYMIGENRILAPMRLYYRDVDFLLTKCGFISPQNFEFLINQYTVEANDVLKLIVSGVYEENNRIEQIYNMISQEPCRIACRVGLAESFRYVAEWLDRQPVDESRLVLLAEIYSILRYVPKNIGTSLSLYYKLLCKIFLFWDSGDKKVITETIKLIAHKNPLLKTEDMTFLTENPDIVADIVEGRIEQGLDSLLEKLNRGQEYSSTEEYRLTIELTLSIAALLENEQLYADVMLFRFEYILENGKLTDKDKEELKDWLQIMPQNEEWQELGRKAHIS